MCQSDGCNHSASVYGNYHFTGLHASTTHILCCLMAFLEDEWLWEQHPGHSSKRDQQQNHLQQSRNINACFSTTLQCQDQACHPKNQVK